jgi:molybdopterin-guanine dinucleotide biosynthesis protein A
VEHACATTSAAALQRIGEGASKDAPGSRWDRLCPPREAVTGLVLCGGASARMGRDKALLEIGGRTMLQRSIDALSAVAGRVLVASGARPRAEVEGASSVLDPFPGAGPLAGLLAGLEAAHSDWLAVLACDMPRARAATLRALLGRAVEARADACLLDLERGSQPLFAVYHRACSKAVRAALERGDRRMVSFLADVRAETLPADALGPGTALDAHNVNTPEDLARLERLP